MSSLSFLGDFRAQQEKLVKSSTVGSTSIYFVNVRGLEPEIRSNPTIESGDSAYARAVQRSRAESINIADTLASDTGRYTIRNTNDPAKEIHRLLDETSVYYLIGYHPKNANLDGKFRKIRVKVKQEGLEIRARKGYYASVREEK